MVGDNGQAMLFVLTDDKQKLTEANGVIFCDKGKAESNVEQKRQRHREKERDKKK